MVSRHDSLAPQKQLNGTNIRHVKLSVIAAHTATAAAGGAVAGGAAVATSHATGAATASKAATATRGIESRFRFPILLCVSIVIQMLGVHR